MLSILTYPDERLKTECEAVTEFNTELHEFISALESTMRAGPGAIGIAAPQVGRLQRVVIVDLSNNPKNENHGRLTLVNPEITAWQGMEKGREGCLSVPDYTGNVIRAKKIVLQAQDEHGEHHEYNMQGFEARAVQHEIDHLDGLLFLDRLVSRRNDLYKRKVYQ